MKSLSILLLLSITSALLIGGLLAVTPAAAGENLPINRQLNSQIAETEPQENAAPSTELAEVESSEAPQTDVVEAVAAEIAEASRINEANALPPVDTTLEPGALIGAAFTANLEKESIPETGLAVESQGNIQQNAVVADNTLNLSSFIQSVSSGQKNVVTGIYADNALALGINQQPSGSPEYITSSNGQVTQFGLASAYGSLGLLAHNYLSGNDFFQLTDGQILTLVYGDGHTEAYKIQTINSFQALQPNSAYSDFIDLDSGDHLSASKLFNRMYNQDDTLVLQTCISNEGISTWGRLFIVATPVLN